MDEVILPQGTRYLPSVYGHYSIPYMNEHCPGVCPKDIKVLRTVPKFSNIYRYWTLYEVYDKADMAILNITIPYIWVKDV